MLVGMLLILAYTLQVHTWSIYSSTSTDSIHGLLGILLYWHFVDAVWISVVYLVYCGQLAVHHYSATVIPLAQVLVVLQDTHRLVRYTYWLL